MRAPGPPWLKTTLVTVAWGAVRTKGSYLQAQFHRLRARCGAKKAIVAVAASMLAAAYHMLKKGVEYHELGAEHFTRIDRSKAIQRLLRRLTELGCDIQLTPHRRRPQRCIPDLRNQELLDSPREVRVASHIAFSVGSSALL